MELIAVLSAPESQTFVKDAMQNPDLRMEYIKLASDRLSEKLTPRGEHVRLGQRQLMDWCYKIFDQPSPAR